MIIDMHHHIDERMEPVDRLISQMEEHGIDRISTINSGLQHCAQPDRKR